MENSYLVLAKVKGGDVMYFTYDWFRNREDCEEFITDTFVDGDIIAFAGEVNVVEDHILYEDYTVTNETSRLKK